MKHKIVLVPFPFDDLSNEKVRPAVCLTDEVRPLGHIVLAFITSRIFPDPLDTDLVIESDTADFSLTGLKVSSTVQLHRLMTVSKRIIKRELGELSPNQKAEVERKLRILFKV